MHAQSDCSSNSISILPAEPQIFHGRESEVSIVVKHFEHSNPRIAILGAGGMGKTSLAKMVLHHEDIVTKYQGNRLFVACDTASGKVELAGLIGVHLGMKPEEDLTRPVLDNFSEGPPTLLILDNLETVWEPIESRKEIEEFLSLLTDIGGIALIITMRGTERPSKVQWTHPFLLPLEPLSQKAAQKIFLDIADDRHSVEEVDQVLRLTDNVPLSISLLAHIVDAEGCTAILVRWHKEQTSVISEGHDQQSNLELSISLSLASPRITSVPHSQELLSLLSILPDGLSDVELKQTNFAIQNILDCKRALLRTALAYTDNHKRLKVLVPIREYMRKKFPPTDEMIRPLLKHFQELLQLFMVDGGKRSTAFCIERLTLNYTNILNIIQNGLKPGHSDLADSMASTADFNRFSELSGQGTIVLIDEATTLLPQSGDHRVKAYFTARLFYSRKSRSISNAETLIAQTFEHFNHFSDPDLQCMFNHIPCLPAV
ncbi:P-loop containing nucleoside triphosphate hydrolase protein [Mycena metata]|uniref:P-loop containing nucleoside triphosphate hydrolase protein n=1 Tax=Mycena metata TaxID=1033252 RepID=A0AAD7NIH5_9AGAR|nr:P-loop containing nucleoside triphosphate hydrolase protein [Mycena metata]